MQCTCSRPALYYSKTRCAPHANPHATTVRCAGCPSRVQASSGACVQHCPHCIRRWSYAAFQSDTTVCYDLSRTAVSVVPLQLFIPKLKRPPTDAPSSEAQPWSVQTLERISTAASMFLVVSSLQLADGWPEQDAKQARVVCRSVFTVIGTEHASACSPGLGHSTVPIIRGTAPARGASTGPAACFEGNLESSRLKVGGST